MDKIYALLGKLQWLWNTRTKKLGLALLISTLLLRFPFVAKFLPTEVYSALMSAASDIVTFTLPLLAFFVKDLLQTGGKIPTTPESEQKINELLQKLADAERRVQDAVLVSTTTAVVGNLVQQAKDQKAA